MNSGRGIANVQSYYSCGLNDMRKYNDQQLVTIYRGKGARLRRLELLCMQRTHVR